MSLLEDARFEAHIAETANRFNIPALGIACVDVGRGHVSSKGFNFPQSEGVTAQTVFQIYSNSKLFTAVAYGILVEEGKCQWNSKICELLPDLNMQDKFANDTLTIEEMLSHQSGLGHGDMTVGGSRCLLLDETVEAINHLRQYQPPRASYRYCNIGVDLVGRIVSIVSNMPFEVFVKTRILGPLEMYSTTWCQPKEGLAVAQGFVTTWKDSKLRQKIPLPCVGLPHNSVLAPGGGMLSTSEDMAKWLNFLLRLAKGCPMSPNLNIIQLDTLKQILRSRVLANEQIGILSVPYGESLWEEMSPPTFALCQLRGNYRGLDISSHNGSGHGGGSIFLWTPARDFGICILAGVFGNAGHAGVSIALCALDMHLGRSTLDWNDRLCLFPQTQNDRLPLFPRPSHTSPDRQLALSNLSGIYVARSWGVVDILKLGCQPVSQEAARVDLLRRYSNSRPFGKMLPEKPELLAIFPPFINGHIFELFHVTGDTWFGVRYLVTELAEEDGSFIRIPIWTANGGHCSRFDFSGFNADKQKAKPQLEFYDAWIVPKQEGPGHGSATLPKAQHV